jgi:hypothetical protein
VPYRAAAELARASGCRDVGLELTRDLRPESNAWEYPLWTLLGAASGDGAIRIQSVGVANESAALAPEFPEVCLVISTASRSAFADPGTWIAHPISSHPLIVVYEKRASTGERVQPPETSRVESRRGVARG